MKIYRFLWEPNQPVVIGFCIILFVYAADAAEVLPPLTVYSPKLSLEELNSNTLSLDENDMGIAHEKTITDVIQGLPGVNIAKVGAFGQPTALYIRGAGGQGVVTLDGLPLLQSLPGLLSLDTLPAEAIQSAAIIRGPDAADQPFQALGGSMHLSTLDRQETGGKLSVEGGSFGILRETLNGGYSGTQGRISATLSRTDAFEGIRAAGGAINTERDPMHFTQGIVRFSTDLHQRLQWQGSMLYRNSGIGIDNYGLDQYQRVAAVDDYGHAHEETWLAQNSFNAQISKNWQSRLQLGYTQMRTTSAFSSGLENSVFTRLYMVNWHNQHSLIDDPTHSKQWQISWGAQGRHEQGQSTTSVFEQERTMVASFIQTRAQYGNVSSELGVRVEQFDQYGDQPLFKAAAAWRINPDFTLRASGGTGYRLPSYNELLFLFFANKNLTPECSASGELGLEWFPTKGAKINLKGFYNRYDDLITIAHEPTLGPVSLNVPDASTAGMELDAQMAWTDSLDTGISYTFSDNRNLQTNAALPFRPPHIGRIWAHQQFRPWPVKLWAEIVVRSSTWNDFENTLPVGEAVLLNASIRYAINPKLELYLRGENITNNHTPQIYSAYAPGAAVYSGVKLEF